jgi:spermidine synthase
VPQPGKYPVDTGTVELLADHDRPGGWLLRIDGTDQSYVDLLDPQHLEFEYMRWIGDLIDLFRPAGTPISVLHLGGGAGALARYVASTRPGSRQLVVERDAALVRLVREQFGESELRSVRVLIDDARTVVPNLPAGETDVVIVDAFQRLLVDSVFTSPSFVDAVGDLLTPAGVCATNLMDRLPLDRTRLFVQTVRERFPHVSVFADPALLRGRRRDNVVTVGSLAPLPLDELRRRGAAAPLTWRALDPGEVDRLVQPVAGGR